MVRSWDVFDTLITRQCVHPTGIFDLMGKVLGEGFCRARVSAEMAARAAKPEITLDDIHDHLQIALGWNADQRARALALELSTEFENVVPIAEHLSRVRDGDIAVSDMYLSDKVILELLRAAGLSKDLTVFVSTHGKADGSMWKRLNRQFLILKHTGDNPHSDFLRPLRHGVPARLTETSAETAWERVLRCNGTPALSAYVREMRLRTWHQDRDLGAVQTAQIEANLPLLLLAGAALVRWCKDHGIQRALMSSRDCVLWTPLVAKLAKHAAGHLAVEYFLTSRVAALKSSTSYLDYAAKRVQADAVVVDLSMTGTSLAGLADRLGMSQVRAFVIAWHPSIAKSLYGQGFQPKAKVKAEFLTAEVIDDDLEALNQALTPSIHDVRETSDGLTVTYASENRSPTVLDAVRVQHAIFTDLIEKLPDAVLAEATEVAGSTRLVFLVRECARHAGGFKTVIARARPGAALWNDPNGLILNLPYVTQRPVFRWLAATTKRLLKPMLPQGSFLYSLGRTSPLIFKALMKTKR